MLANLREKSAEMTENEMKIEFMMKIQLRMETPWLRCFPIDTVVTTVLLKPLKRFLYTLRNNVFYVVTLLRYNVLYVTTTTYYTTTLSICINYLINNYYVTHAYFSLRFIRKKFHFLLENTSNLYYLLGNKGVAWGTLGNMGVVW